MKIQVKKLKKGDQFSLNRGCRDVVKNIRPTKNVKGYFDIKTKYDTFEVNGEWDVEVHNRN